MLLEAEEADWYTLMFGFLRVPARLEIHCETLLAQIKHGLLSWHPQLVALPVQPPVDGHGSVQMVDRNFVSVDRGNHGS